MILLIGQVARAMRGREAFQEIDYRQMFGGIAKWVAEIDDPTRIPELVARAFHTATSDRPGPVVLALPEDMLTEPAAAPMRSAISRSRRTRRQTTWPGCARSLASARRPFMILGGGGWDARACADIHAFAEAFELPVGVSFRRQDYFDNRHPCYAGHVGISVAPPLSDRVRDADLLLLVGTRLGEASSRSYTLIDVPEPKQTLVHVHPGANELGLVYTPDLPIHAGVRAFAAAARALEPVDTSAWRAETEVAHAQYLASQTPPPIPGELQLGEVLVWLRENLPADAIVTNGAGNYCVWVNGYYQYRGVADPARPDQRLDGLRHAGRDRREAGPPGPDRRRLRRRRLLPDDRPGDRDRRPIRRAGHLVRGQQRHVRHDPHAPGAGLPEAGRSAPSSRTRISQRSPAPTAATARSWSARPTSRTPSGARKRPKASRCSICGSTRRR